MIFSLFKTTVGSQSNEVLGDSDSPGIQAPLTEDTERRSAELEDQPTKTLADQLQELQERYPSGDRRLFGELQKLQEQLPPGERLGVVGPGMYIAPGRYGQVMDKMMERTRKEVTDEVNRPSGDREERRKGNLQHDQTERRSSQRGENNL